MNEIEDLGTAESRLKGTKYFEKRKLRSRIYTLIAVIIAFYAFAVCWQAFLQSQAKTQQEAITQSQIKNGIEQKSWFITYKNI